MRRNKKPETETDSLSAFVSGSHTKEQKLDAPKEPFDRVIGHLLKTIEIARQPELEQRRKNVIDLVNQIQKEEKILAPVDEKQFDLFQQQIKDIKSSLVQVKKISSTDPILQVTINNLENRPDAGRVAHITEAAKEIMNKDIKADEAMKTLIVKLCLRRIEIALISKALDMIFEDFHKVSGYEKRDAEIRDEINTLDAKLVQLEKDFKPHPSRGPAVTLEQLQSPVKRQIRELGAEREKLANAKAIKKSSIEAKLNKILPFIKKAEELRSSLKTLDGGLRAMIDVNSDFFDKALEQFHTHFNAVAQLTPLSISNVAEHAASKVGRSRQSHHKK